MTQGCGYSSGVWGGLGLLHHGYFMYEFNLHICKYKYILHYNILNSKHQYTLTILY